MAVSVNSSDSRADKVLKAYQHSRDSLNQNIADSEKALRYLINNPWSDADKANAKAHNKPLLRYPILLPILSNLQGNEQLSRRRGKIKPTSVEDVKAVEILQARWNLINDEQDLEEKLQSVFLDGLSTKMGGWIQRDFELNEEGYLDFKYKLVNNMRIFPDPEWRVNDYEMKSCRWIIKEGWEPLDVIIEKYKITREIRMREEEQPWYWKLVEVIKRITDKRYSASDEYYDKENDRYKILEMQERVSKKMVLYFDGENYHRSGWDDFKKLRKDNPHLEVIRDYDVNRIHVTTMIPAFENMVVQDEDLDHPSGNFDLFSMFSYALNVQVDEGPSLIDLLLDIQDDINKGKSQVRDYVTQIVSGGIFINKQEKEVIKQLKRRGNQPNQVYGLLDPQNKPYQLGPGSVPPDILVNTENSMQYSERVSMVNASMKGETERSGESGVLFQQKVSRAAAAINPFYKNLGNLRKMLLKDFVDNVSYVYAEDDRPIQVKREDGNIGIEILNLNLGGQMLNDVRNISARVELDEGEDNITAKEEDFNRLLALVNVISQINPAFVDLKTLVSQAPIPGAKEMVDYIDQQIQAQAQGAQQQEQIDNTRKSLENMKIQRGMINDEQKLQLEAQKLSLGAKS